MTWSEILKRAIKVTPRIQAEKDSRFVFFSTGRDLKVGLRGE